MEMGEKLIANRDKQAEDLYIKNVEDNITKNLEDKGYIVHKIDLEIETNDENNYGKINNISINIAKNNDIEADKSVPTQNNSNTIKISEIQKVQKVNINDNNINNSVESNNTSNRIEEKEINIIKDFLENTYNVKKENVFINE